MIADIDPALTADTLLDAEEAYASVGALVEMFDGCEKGRKVTASLYVGLLRNVRGHLENVVHGLQVLEGHSAAG